MTTGTRGPVLVVEDDAGIQDTIMTALEEEGYAVLQADDWPSMERALRQRPALILLDLMLPHLDGVEASQCLKANAATQAIPVVAFTAVDRRRVGAEVRVDDWLAKPFDVAELYAVVARWAPH